MPKPVLNMKNTSIVNDSGMYVPNHQDSTIEDIDKVCNITNNTGKTCLK